MNECVEVINERKEWNVRRKVMNDKMEIINENIILCITMDSLMARARPM